MNIDKWGRIIDTDNFGNFLRKNFVVEWENLGAGYRAIVYMHNDKEITLCFYNDNNDEGIEVPFSKWTGWAVTISYGNNNDKKFASELKKKIKKIYPKCHASTGKY